MKKLICIVGKKRSGKDTAADILLDSRHGSSKYALANPIKEALSYAYNSSNFQEKTGVVLDITHFDGFDEINMQYDREQPIAISNLDALEMMEVAIKYLKHCYNLKEQNEFDTIDITNKLRTICFEPGKFWSIRRMMQTLGTDVIVELFDRQFWNRIMMNDFIDWQNKSLENAVFIVSDVRQEHEINLMRALGALIIFVERDNINKNIIDDHITEAGLVPTDNDIVIKNDGSIEDLKQKLLEVI